MKNWIKTLWILIQGVIVATYYTIKVKVFKKL